MKYNLSIRNKSLYDYSNEVVRVAIVLLCICSSNAYSQTTQTFTLSGTFVPPAGITVIKVVAWGAGGGGGGAAHASSTAVGGGGGGGSYAENPSVAVTAVTSYSVNVGLGGQGGTSVGLNGEMGNSSTFNSSSVVALGGIGGFGSANGSNGGTGGASGSSTGTTKNSGGNGANGNTTTGGGGGGGSAGTGVGGNGGNPTAGTAGTGGGAAGGAGGNSTTGSNGANGVSPGGGGGGGRRGSDNTNRSGGNGANGQIQITYTCPTYSLSSTSGTSYSTGNGSTITLTHTTTSNLPVGTYTVTYNLSGANTATAQTATMIVSAAGTGTFVTRSLTNSGSTTVTVTNLSSGSSTGCTNAIGANNTVAVSSNDFFAISGGNWNNNDNWSRIATGGAGCACNPTFSSTDQVVNDISGGSAAAGIAINSATVTVGSISGTGQFRGSISSAIPATLVVGGNNSSTTFSGFFNNNNSLTSPISITKVGTGALTLSGANTHTGTNLVSNGTLSLANVNALGNTSATTVSAGGTLDINGVSISKNITISGNGSNSVGALTGTGTASISGTIALGANTSVGGSGTLTASGAISGAFSLEKVGTGTLVLSGANTYSGGTKISSGSLILGASGVLANAGVIDFAGGALKSGTTTGFSEVMGNINISNNSILGLGTGVHSLNFNAKGTFTANKTLTITGWTGAYNGTSGTSGKVFIGTTAALSSNDLSQIRFYDGTNYFPAIQLATGEVVPGTNSCPSVPSETSVTVPATVTTLPTNGTSLSNTTNYGLNASSLTVTGAILGGNSSTNIYVKSGETLTITSGIAAFPGNLYVLSGGTLILDNQIGGTGNIYVYGTFVQRTATGDVQDAVSVYVASTGIYQTAAFNMTGTAKMIVEGSFITDNFRFFGNTSTSALPQFCLNNSGCVKISAVTDWIGSTVSPLFQGNGSVYYPLTNCPTNIQSGGYSNSSLLKICAPNLTGPCANFGSATVYYGSACSSGGAAISSCAGFNALPITLTFFKATLSNEGVIVRWGTTSQWNSDYFIIERSKNGIDWEYVEVVPSKNGKSRYQEFGIIDPNPNSGDNYYRLTEVDKDGNKTVYGVDYVEIDTDYQGFTIYPNPTNGELNIAIFGNSDVYQLELFDITGKSVWNEQLKSGINNLGTLPLNAGMYLAKLKVNRDYFTRKVIFK